MQAMAISNFLYLLVAASAVVTVLQNGQEGSSARTGERNTSVQIESFDKDGGRTKHRWSEINDPVMGGRSTGSFHVDATRGVGVFKGEVVDVPFLQAPGFIQVRTVDSDTDDNNDSNKHHLRTASSTTSSSSFPDVSQCTGLQLTVRSPTTADYQGFRVSFGKKHARGGKHFAFGFKTDLKHVEPDWVDIVLPFSQFTDFWDDATGDAIHTCQENPEYCPDSETLQNMRTMAIWAEGVGGVVDLEIKEIRAVGCFSQDGLVDNHNHKYNYNS